MPCPCPLLPVPRGLLGDDSHVPAAGLSAFADPAMRRKGLPTMEPLAQAGLDNASTGGFELAHRQLHVRKRSLRGRRAGRADRALPLPDVQEGARLCFLVHLRGAARAFSLDEGRGASGRFPIFTREAAPLLHEVRVAHPRRAGRSADRHAQARMPGHVAVRASASPYLAIRWGLVVRSQGCPAGAARKFRDRAGARSLKPGHCLTTVGESTWTCA